MVADVHLKPKSIKLIVSDVEDGRKMIAVSRAILQGDYPQRLFDSDLFNVFQTIADDTADVVLEGYGEINSLSGSNVPANENRSDGYFSEIYGFYYKSFCRAISEFREKIIDCRN